MLESDDWQYNKVVFAGTFDHLHEGHKHIIRQAFRLSKIVAQPESQADDVLVTLM